MQTSTNSLFGGGNSLFGATTASQNQPAVSQPQSAFGPGAFGNSNATQTPSLFGQSTSQPQQTNANQASLFSTTLGNSIINGQQQQQQAQPQQATQNDQDQQQAARLRSRRFPTRAQLPKPGQLPSINKGIDDLLNGVNSLGAVKASTNARENNRGRDILAASGVPRGATIRDLQTFSTSVSTNIPAPAVLDELDIDAYVAGIRSKSTQDLINESLEQTKRDFSAFLEENIQMNWQEQRQRIHEHFGIARPSSGLADSRGRNTQNNRGFGRSSNAQPNMSFGPSPMSKSVLGGSISRGSARANPFTDVVEKTDISGQATAIQDPSVRAKEEKYASKIRQLNAARKQDVIYPILHELASVEAETEIESTLPLVDAYRALIAIVRENGSIRDTSDPGAVKPRQYMQDYLDENSNSPKSIALRKRILDGTRKYLEDSYMEEVETLVARNPQEANLGGVPTKINKLRALLRIKAARKDLSGEGAELQMLGDDYCWALIYQLLRCGLVTEAAEYVVSNGRAFKALDARFPGYIAAFAKDPDRRLPRDMQARINAEYSQRIKLAPENSIDPYRMACYKIVGRCELASKNLEDIPMQMKDWTWLVFVLAREVNRVEETAIEYYGLEDARSIVEQIGLRHFAPNQENSNDYGTFFLMQILAGLFEKAVSYLYSYNYVSAVHFAIALTYYGLLRVSNPETSGSELLTYTTRTNPQINFGRMVGYYTRDFRLVQAENAVDYIVLLCLPCDLPGPSSESYSSICQQALKELVFETREFAILLGDFQSSGRKLPGAIQERLKLIDLTNQNEFIQTLILQSAAIADDSGRTADAVLLYHLAEDYDRVIEIVNESVSNAITVDLGQDDLRMEPLKPRTTAGGQNGQQQQQQQGEKEISLSLTAIDDPIVLARTMVDFYSTKALAYGKIRETNRSASSMLLQICSVRSLMRSLRFGLALDEMQKLQMVPLTARGNQQVIMSAVQSFDRLPSVVSRVIGSMLVWTLTALSAEKQRQGQTAFVRGGEESDRLLQAARDTMVFAGLIKFKLPSDVFELLAKAGQSVGAY